MSPPGGMTAAALFGDIAADYLRRPGVAYGRIWHNDGLKVNDKIFAMVVRDQLVVKVPAAEAAELVAAGSGTLFEPRPGRAMREWVSVAAVDPPRWRQLVADAFAYGCALTRKRR